MGPLQGYFDYYEASCKKNKTIDFIIINDLIRESYKDENIQYIKLNIKELSQLCSAALAEQIELKNSWKINELKPLFGIIFKKQLELYDHWGWCDLDIIWGEIRDFMTNELLSSFDVITSKVNWTAGHFTLFKNNAYLNNLYKKNKNIIALLNDPTYYAFEECCHRWDGEFFSADELSEKNLPLSMFDIVKGEEKKGGLKAYFNQLVREYPQPINYLYKDGKLFDLNTSDEFMYYHLLTVKKIWRFYIPNYKQSYIDLTISPKGIKPVNEISALWTIKRAINCFYGIRKSIKTQSTKEILNKLSYSVKGKI